MASKHLDSATLIARDKAEAAAAQGKPEAKQDAFPPAFTKKKKKGAAAGGKKLPAFLTKK